MFRNMLIAVFVMTLSACTSVSETPLSANVWQISVEGRGGLGAASVDKALLKRAAELTLEQGFDRFFLSSPENRDQIVHAGNTPITTTGSANIVGSSIYGNATTTGGDPILVRIKSSTVLIAMLSADDPNAVNALDARLILQRMSTQ